MLVSRAATTAGPDRADADAGHRSAHLAGTYAACAGGACRQEADPADQHHAKRVAGDTFRYGGFIKADFMTTRTSDGALPQGAVGRYLYIPTQTPIGGQASSTDTDFHAKFSRFNLGVDTVTEKRRQAHRLHRNRFLRQRPGQPGQPGQQSVRRHLAARLHELEQLAGRSDLVQLHRPDHPAGSGRYRRADRRCVVQPSDPDPLHPPRLQRVGRKTPRP